MTCHLSVLDAQTAAPNRHTQRVSLEDEDDDEDDYDGTGLLRYPAVAILILFAASAGTRLVSTDRSALLPLWDD